MVLHALYVEQFLLMFFINKTANPRRISSQTEYQQPTLTSRSLLGKVNCKQKPLAQFTKNRYMERPWMGGKVPKVIYVSKQKGNSYTYFGL